MTARASRGTSFWIATTPETSYPSLEPDVDVDVAVIGGGITGLSVAFEAKQAGAKVAVLEAGRIVQGVTGHTTGKLTSQHGLIYDTLISKQGEGRAGDYAEANEWAIGRVAELAGEESGAGAGEGEAIECDFERMPAFVYTEQDREVATIEAEVEAARKLGLPASLTNETGLPWPVRAAIRFDAQARFHPRKFCLALAERIAGDGSFVFERTPVMDVEEGSPCKVQTDKGSFRAKQVVIATHLPLGLWGLFFAKTAPARSYVLTLRLHEPPPRGMYITAGKPTRSLRPHPAGDGEEILLLSGEGHKTGQDTSSDERYERLERFAAERLPLKEVEHRWSAQDYYPADGVPYIGRLGNGQGRVFVATGFKAWGLTHAVIAARIVSAQLLGRPAPWTELYDPNRVRPRASAKKLLKENLEVGRRFVTDRLAKRREISPDEIASGEGQIGKLEGEWVAASRDSAGEFHAVSPVCTHMGCTVAWNKAEQSWDCPCHGSRFTPQGEIIEGPATQPLKARILALK